MSKSSGKLIRENAPVFASGFRFGIADSVAIVDFVDVMDDDNHRILFSVGLTKKQAKNFVKQLSDFIDEEE